MTKSFFLLFAFLMIGLCGVAQHHDVDKEEVVVSCAKDDEHHEEEFDPGKTAFHHISDANVYSIGPIQIPLPCILYAKGNGLSVFSSAKFKPGLLGHGNGSHAYKGYVLKGSQVMRVHDKTFPKEQVKIGGFITKKEMHNGEEEEHDYVCFNGNTYPLEFKSKADGGLFGGGMTSFIDFSITKNVVSMALVFLALFFIFRAIAKAYTKRKSQAPKGIQSFMEPVFLFMQDEVIKPFVGKQWEKYLPFLMSLFFFILGLNLFGQIPFLGGSNVTGNLAVTMVLAVFAFFVTNLSGNSHYWQHVFWMPGTPAWLKIILTPVEILGIFIKPLTLMLRLFANITAGHMVIIIFVSLIFIFGQVGANQAAGYGTAIGSALLSLFMMAIELLVAFIQAFVFTILTASYIGAAIEEHH